MVNLLPALADDEVAGLVAHAAGDLAAPLPDVRLGLVALNVGSVPVTTKVRPSKGCAVRIRCRRRRALGDARIAGIGELAHQVVVGLERKKSTTLSAILGPMPPDRFNSSADVPSTVPC
ncbi:MAG: hypothetical protein R3A10_13395 [Caldilineaceae bacterium]